MTTATDTLADELAERFSGSPLRIGTRTTALAQAQTRRVITRIGHAIPRMPVEIVEIQTSADLWTGDLSQLGGKGNFTKEIDRSLISGRIDIAVHSMKDVPGDVPLPKWSVSEFLRGLTSGPVLCVSAGQMSGAARWSWQAQSRAFSGVPVMPPVGRRESS
ncbi:hypothetical protein [Saccharopolyspora hattusasensis]|uniref:hypothetical protein n=1 Tax=Saccharopolyspora hattusasensis TaxID=1128679 RepID=UPI003D972AD5